MIIGLGEQLLFSYLAQNFMFNQKTKHMTICLQYQCESLLASCP